MSCSWRSAQARSCKNKPPLPALRTCLIKSGPLLPRDSFPGRGAHPVPVDLDEVRKLCHIEHGAAAADFELVAKPRRMPTTRWIPTDPMPTSAFAVHLSATARVRAKLIPHQRFQRPSGSTLRTASTSRSSPPSSSAQLTTGLCRSPVSREGA